MSTVMRVFLVAAAAAAMTVLAGCNTRDYRGPVVDDINRYAEREWNERHELPDEFRRFWANNFDYLQLPRRARPPEGEFTDVSAMPR